MLVLSRKCQQSIVIGDGIEITVMSVKGDTVRFAIDAPRHVPIYRAEIYDRIRAAGEEVIAPGDSDHRAAKPRM